MTGIIIANRGQLTMFGIKDYSPGQKVLVEEIRDPSFVNIRANGFKATKIMRHLVKTDIPEQSKIKFK